VIRFGEEICGNLDAALRREWLETNGLGGFASSTILGLNARRYHGLLVAAVKPPVGRTVLLSKFEETLFINGEAFHLSANRYPGVVHPRGFEYLKQFRINPFPEFTYEVQGVEIRKTVFMVHGQNSTVIQYELKSKGREEKNSIHLELRPLIAFRDYHSTTHENGALNSTLEVAEGMVSISPYQGLPTLHLGHSMAELINAGTWYRNFEYDAERDRGLDYAEDLFNPYTLRFDLITNPKANLVASTEPLAANLLSSLRAAEVERRKAIAYSALVHDDVLETLTLATEQYIVNRRDQKTVIAGYHWFSDWGRDTMIALPGLTLPTGRFEVARSVLRTFAQNVDRGMLPNRFPDAGEQPEYNTVDATLWFFEAIRAYASYSGDYELVSEFYPVLNDIISWHVKGTRYNIKLDQSGLLSSGEPGVQLTWMDAKVGDWVVTPRRGKPVEIQALWYNALCIMEDFARRFSDEAGQKRYRTMAALTQWSFNRLFWNEKEGCLYDVINGGPPDPSIRPNQIFAISLHHQVLSQEKAKLVIDKIREHLLTPYGLRSLAPSDRQYRGNYGGGPSARDGAYHQGTVWPWLIGPFITAYLKVNGRSEATLKQADSWLRPLISYMQDAGVGHVPEIFSGDAPHTGAGCVAQAWSDAELLRVVAEDIRGLRPHSEILQEHAVNTTPVLVLNL
jgi:predicted glycogen debranching enzyme